MTWKKLSSQEKYSNRYMTVTEDEVITDHGDKLIYGVVHKKPFVVIIPWDGERTLLVGQYRYAVDNFSWEFPMGHAESLTIEDAARKELSEETGLVTKDIKSIGRFYPANGHLDQIGHIFVTTKYSEGKQELEPSEKGMKIKWVTLDELNSMLKDGTIKDGPTITAFKFFELYISKK